LVSLKKDAANQTNKRGLEKVFRKKARLITPAKLPNHPLGSCSSDAFTDTLQLYNLRHKSILRFVADLTQKYQVIPGQTDLVYHKYRRPNICQAA